MFTVCVCVCTELDFWRLDLLNSSPPIHSPHPFCQLYSISALSILYRLCVCVVFNAVMSEGKRYLHALSFAHCVRAKSVWGGDRAGQSPGSVLTPCRMRSLWAAAGALGLTHCFTLGLWTEMFAVWAVPVWKNVSIRI